MARSKNKENAKITDVLTIKTTMLKELSYCLVEGIAVTIVILYCITCGLFEEIIEAFERGILSGISLSALVFILVYFITAMFSCLRIIILNGKTKINNK